MVRKASSQPQSGRAWLRSRWLLLWLAFALGTGIGAFVENRLAGSCDVKVIDLDTDGLVAATQAAIPAALTGSGFVRFTLSPTGVRVQGDSMFENQSFDQRLLAVVQGSPVTVEVSTKLLRRILSH